MIEEMVGGPHDGMQIQSDNISDAHHESGWLPLVCQGDCELYYYQRYEFTNYWYCHELSLECMTALSRIIREKNKS